MNVVSLVIIGAFAVYFVFVEYLDWRGRMEVLEAKHPLLWKAVNARPFRLILLFLIFGMLAENSRERIQEIEVEPLVVKVNAVPSPDPGAKNAEIIRLQGELASLRSKQETRAERLIASRPSRMFEVEAHDPGNLTVKHGAGCTPYHVSWEMTSGGNFWLQKPISYDKTNVYFVASDEGITAKVLVWCP